MDIIWSKAGFYETSGHNAQDGSSMEQASWPEPCKLRSQAICQVIMRDN